MARSKEHQKRVPEERADTSQPVKINLAFDEAIKRALDVKPPEGGWKALDKKAKKRRKG